MNQNDHVMNAALVSSHSIQRNPPTEHAGPLEAYSHPGFSRTDFSGTVYSFICERLKNCTQYQQMRDGGLSPAQYLAWLEGTLPTLTAQGLTTNQCHLVSRFPQSDEAFVDEALDSLFQAGLITSTEYPKSDFLAFREQVRALYNHDGYMTFIFPEEERLVFALAYSMRPREALFLGSYYGYWGIWMMPAVMASRGMATFIDPNPHANSVSRRNLTALGFSQYSNVVDAEGVQFLERTPHQKRRYDFVLLDAEGPEDAPDPDFRGKRVYKPLIEAVHPHLREGAVVTTHNILVRHTPACSYFNTLVTNNAEELSGFLDYTSQHFSRSAIIDSTEGVGMYKL